MVRDTRIDSEFLAFVPDPFRTRRKKQNMQTATEEITERYWKVSRAARELGVDASWIYRAVARGDLQGVEIGGLVVERASVERLKTSRAHEATAVA